MNIHVLPPSKPATQQGGAVLIVALIILAVVTVLGVAGMRASTLELRMANSLQERVAAFQVAERVLAMAEQKIYESPFDRATILAADTTCGADDSEKKHLCFSGTFDSPEGYDDCSLTNPDPSVSQQFWQIEENWNNSEDVELAMSRGPDQDPVNVTVQCMIEFMCFVPRRDLGVESDKDMLPLYRITVRTQPSAISRAEVMLQSTLEGPIF